LTNPLLAVEELGYELAPGVAREVELRLRFGPGQRKQVRELEERICATAGRRVDPQSAEDLESVLFGELKLRRPADMGSLGPPDVVDCGRKRVRREPFSWKDPLTALADAHPIVPLLLEYRDLQASRPPFAPRELYEQLKSGRRQLPIRSVSLQHVEHQEHEEGPSDA
jgi:hypothetical protein